MKIYFISGTDTGVGKTLASAILCRHLLKLGKTAYVKPVQTGGAMIDAAFVNSVCTGDLLTFCPVSFQLPASPHLAAAEEGCKIDEEKLVADIKEFAKESNIDYLVVEGAGGLSVPLHDECDMAKICQMLEGELVVVTRSGLGTLNHTFLTVNYAKSLGLKSSLIISGCSKGPDVIEADNIKRVSDMVDGRVLFCIPVLENLDTEECIFGDIPEVAIFL